MFHRISMAEARARYEGNRDFVMVACNLRPNCFQAMEVSMFTRMERRTFDDLVNEYRYYNCINQETGRRVAFYRES